MFEGLNHYLPKIEVSNILSTLGIENKNYFLVSVHREENVDPIESISRLVNALNYVADHYNLPVIVSTHPRTKRRINDTKLKFHPNVSLKKPQG